MIAGVDGWGTLECLCLLCLSSSQGVFVKCGGSFQSGYRDTSVDFVGLMTGLGSEMRAAAVMRGVDLEDFRAEGILVGCFADGSNLYGH
jgi:hypothetical protein